VMVEDVSENEKHYVRDEQGEKVAATVEHPRRQT
jgi:hypothetical protein